MSKEKSNRSPRQREQASKAISGYWEKVRAGEAQPPRRGPKTDLTVFRKSGKVRSKSVRAEIEQFSEGLIQELGGRQSLAPSQAALVRVAKSAYAGFLICESVILGGTVVVETDDGTVLSPAVRALPGYCRQLSRLISALGLPKRSKPTRPKIEAVFERYRQQKSDVTGD